MSTMTAAFPVDRADYLATSGAIYVPPAAPDGDTRWLALYRLSAATETNAGGIRNQRDAARAAVRTNGAGEIALEHAERGTSAFDREEPWPGFLVAWGAVERGDIDGIVSFNMDRFCRDKAEQALFERHCKRHGVRYLLLNGNLTDPANPDDSMTNTILGAIAQRESEIKRARMKLNHASKALAGKWHGSRPFGYQKKNGTLVIDKREAAVIREWMRRALSGTPMLQLAREANAKGVVGTKGGTTWTATSVRQALEKWAICGVRSHKGEPVADGDWQAIVSRAEVEAFRAGLSRRTRPGRPEKALLAGLMVCACHGRRCGSNGRNYSAALGGETCVGIQMAKAEEFVIDAFMFALADGGYRSEAEQADAERLAVIESELARVETERNELDAAVESGDSTMAQALRLGAALTERESALRRQAALIAVRPSGDALEGVERRWQTMSTPERRAALSVLIERVELAPCGSSARPPASERLRIVWRQ